MLKMIYRAGLVRGKKEKKKLTSFSFKYCKKSFREVPRFVSHEQLMGRNWIVVLKYTTLFKVDLKKMCKTPCERYSGMNAADVPLPP